MMAGSLHEEAALSESALCRDNAAIAQLLTQEQVALTRFVAGRLSRRLAPRLDATDVVQDVFVLAVRRFPVYVKGCLVPFPAWLHAIAVERLRQIHRIHVQTLKRSICREKGQDQSHKCYSRGSRAGPCSTPDEWLNSELDRHELYERVKILATELPQCDQDLLRLRIVEERPIEQVATMLGIKCGTVRVRQNRVLRRLRERLRDEARDADMPRGETAAVVGPRTDDSAG